MVKQFLTWQWMGLGLGFLGSLLVTPFAMAQNVQIIPSPNGTGTIVEVNGQQFNISGGAFSGDGRNLFHLFKEFGLNKDQIANFLANPELRNILAGVNGGNPSVINGLLQVTGGNPNLYLLNPAGIIFGANAQLNVPAAFAATTATGVEFGGGWFSLNGTNNFHNLVGNPIGFAFTGNQAGSIVNEGNLSVNSGQSLLLLGGNVVNTGNLSAPGGEITVAAVPGQSLVRISQQGQLLSLDIRTPQPGDSLPNDWQLPILSLPELLTGPGAGRVNQVSVNPDGSIQLASTSITPNPGITALSGVFNVSSSFQGGAITALGTDIHLLGANLNANGELGGGTIRIGGEYLGGVGLPQAKFVNVDANSVLAANALNTGDGGRVILWSEDQTSFNGQISARGGQFAGNGGFVETSSKNILRILEGSVDAGSNLGSSGTWLLDPTAIQIVASGGGGIGTSVVNVGLINSALNSNTNVTLNTSLFGGGDILQNSNARINHTANNQPTLTMIASGAISVLGGINSTFSGLSVNLSAGDSAGGAVDPNASHQITIAGPQQLTMRTLETKTDAWTEIRQSIKTTGDQTYNSFVSVAPDSDAFLIGQFPPFFLFPLESTAGALIFNDKLSITTNSVVLTANNFVFNGGDGSISGQGGVIGLVNNGSFTLNQALLNKFADGFVAIGFTSLNNSSVELSSNISVKSPLVVIPNFLASSTVNQFNINTRGFNIETTGSVNPILPGLTLQGPGGVTASNLMITNGSTVVSTNSNPFGLPVILQPSSITVGNVSTGTDLSLLTTGTLTTGGLNAAGAMTLVGASGVTLNDVIGATQAPSSLTITGPTIITSNVTTSGNQIYNGLVTINAASPTTATSPVVLNSQNGILSFGSILAAGANDLELFTNGTDAVVFNGGPGSVTGTKGIIFASNSSLIVNQSVITPLADGFEFIAFASKAPDSTAVVLTSDLTVNDPLILFGPAVNTQGQSITAHNNASVTLQGFGTNGVITNSITTSGQPITISSSNDFGDPLSSLSFAPIDTTGGALNANGSTIQILTNGNINTGNLTNTSGTGLIRLTGFDIDTTAGTISSPNTLAQVQINAVNNIQIGNISPASFGSNGGIFTATSQDGTVTLTQPATFNLSAVNLTAHRGITTQAITTGGGAITLNSTSGNINTSGQGLVSNGGVITLNNAAGNITTGVVTSGGGTIGITTTTGAVSADLITSQDGNVNVTTESGSVQLNGITTFTGATNLVSQTGVINTGNLSSSSGAIQASTGGNLTTGTIDTQGVVTLAGLDVTVGAIGETLSPASLAITSAANTTFITANITTIGNQSYVGPVVLNPSVPTSLENPLQLTSESGNIIFGNSLNVVTHNLVLDANGSSPFQFNGGLGSVTSTNGTLGLTTENSLTLNQVFLNSFADGLSRLAISSAPESGTSSQITLSSNLQVANPLQIAAPQINTSGFGITGLGDASLTIQGQQVTTNSLSTQTGAIIVSTGAGLDPTTNLQVGPIQTGAIRSNSGNISLLTDGTLNSGALNTSGDVTLRGTTGVTLNGAVGSTQAPNTLEITGPTTIRNSIKTTGNQIYNSDVTIAPGSNANTINQFPPYRFLPIESTSGSLTFNSNLSIPEGSVPLPLAYIGVVLTGNSFQFNGSDGSISGKDGIIGLANNSSFTLNQALLNKFADGFGAIGFTSLNNSSVELSSNISVNSPLVVIPNFLSGPTVSQFNINTRGFNIEATGNASLTLLGPGGVVANNLTTANGAITVQGPGGVTANSVSSTNGPITISTSSNATDPLSNLQAGTITVGNISSNSSLIQALTSGTLTTGTIDTAGNVLLQGSDVSLIGTIGSTLSPTNLSIISSNTIAVNSPITVNNAIVFQGGVTTVGANIVSSGDQSYTGDVTFSADNITFQASNGSLTFNNAINLTPVIYNLNLIGNNFNFNGGSGSISSIYDVETVSLQANGEFTVDQNLMSSFGVGLAVVELTSPSKILLSSNISLAQALQVSAPTIDTQGFGITGTNGRNLSLIANDTLKTGSLNTLGSIFLQGADVAVNGVIGSVLQPSLLNVTSTSATTTTISSNITTTGDQNFNGTVVITAPTTLTSDAGNITFNNTLDGATSLTLQASSINFNGSVGSITPLSTLTVTGNTNVGGNVTTYGDQVFNAPLTITGSNNVFRSTNGNLNFNSLTANGQPINLDAANNITTRLINSRNSSGNGGNVNLTGNAIQVEAINAQGSQAGGTVNITANSRFQATGTFIDQDDVNASISAAGGTSNGTIKIQINSAAPFVVGGSSENGTAGAITTGTNNTIANQTFPASTTIGSFELITLGTVPPTPPQPPSPLTPEEENEVSAVLLGQENSQSSSISLLNVPQTTLINRDVPLTVTFFEELQCQAFSDYFGRGLCKRPQSLEEIQGILTKITTQTKKTPGVIYVLSRPEQVEVLLVTGENEPIRRVIPGVTQAQLSELAQQFSNQVRDPRFIGTNVYLSNAQKLYQLLIQPIAADLQAQKVDTLLFSLDTGLRTIPLAALHDGQQFLVEQYALGLIPSMSLIEPTYRDIRQDKILAMGADTFTDLAPLPAVSVELATITQDLGGGVKFLNQDFTVRNLETQRQKQDFAVVHLATHGEFNPGSVKDSFIAFSDRRVNLEQMRRLRLNLPTTDLLTLSACRTAVGDEQAELGFAGLAVQSGIKTALASLWYVSDEGTLGLMTEFYQQLGQAPIKAEALRQAQLAMIRGQVTIKDGELISTSRQNPIKLPPGLANVPNRTLNHPYYWAAFTMIGSPW